MHTAKEKRDIISHYSNLNLPSRVKCKSCDEMWETKWDMQRHEMKAHKPHTCQNCGDKFKSETSLDTHSQNINGKED